MACGRLLKRLNANKVFWVKNYFKTVTASTLVGSGIGLIVTGELTRMRHQGWSDAELILGGACVVLAFLVTFVLDIWTKKQDEQIINNIEDYIEDCIKSVVHIIQSYY